MKCNAELDVSRADVLAPRENAEQMTLFLYSVCFFLLVLFLLFALVGVHAHLFASRPSLPVDVLVGSQLACCTAALNIMLLRPIRLVFSPGRYFSRLPPGMLSQLVPDDR